MGASIDASRLLGFWRLVFTNDVAFLKRGGASGFGGMPFCYLAAHWQCYQDKAPTGQTVEIIADTNLGRHSIAALKGAWDVGAQEESEAYVTRPVTEKYDRSEFGGAVQSSKPVVVDSLVTYVGDSVRVSRQRGGESVYVYVRASQEEVGAQIQGWIDQSVPGVSKREALWQQGPAESGPGASTLGN